jgi:hypothetical protein
MIEVIIDATESIMTRAGLISRMTAQTKVSSIISSMALE